MTQRQYQHAVGVLRRRTSLHEGDIEHLAREVWNPMLSDRINIRRCAAKISNHVRELTA